MDWSRLTSLTIDYHYDSDLFYTTMAPYLPHLQDLSLLWNSTGPLVPISRLSFLVQLPPLHSLSILFERPYQSETRTSFPLDEIFDIHGPSLRSLSLHQHESSVPINRRPMLSLAEIDVVRARSPRLEHLGLDIDRNGTFPYDHLRAIAAIPTLTSLTLNMEVGTDLLAGDSGEYGWNAEGPEGPGPWREPRMNVSAAENLFAELRAMKRGKSLQKVEFGVGDWVDNVYSGPAFGAPWMAGRPRKFSCAVDREGKGVCYDLGGKNDAERRMRDEELGLGMGGKEPGDGPWLSIGGEVEQPLGAGEEKQTEL
jgi:hypothetical protein